MSARKTALIAALALLLPATPTQAAPTGAQVATTAELRLPHISIVTMGKGSPVILIPGLASPRAVWDDVAPELAKTHRVILVQVNGFGGDDPGANLQPGVLDGIVADLDGYITREKLHGTLVIGHSMGGLVGLMLAKAHPADLARLMIVDSLPYFAVLMAPPGIDPTPCNGRAASRQNARRYRRQLWNGAERCGGGGADARPGDQARQYRPHDHLGQGCRSARNGASDV